MYRGSIKIMAKSTQSKKISSRLHISTTIEELSDLDFISKRTYNGCKYNGVHTLGDILNLNKAEIKDWRGCGKKVEAELQTLIEDVTSIWGKSLSITLNTTEEDQPKSSLIINRIEQNVFCLGLISLANLILHNNDHKFILSPNEMQTIFSLLERAGSEVPEQFPLNVNMILEKIGVIEKLAMASTDESTSNPISEKIQGVSDKIYEAIESSGIIGETKSVIDNIITPLFYKKDYPFLSDKEIEFCINYKSEYGNLPKLYILHKFLIRSTDRQAQMVCHRYGLYADGISKPLDEIAEMFELSRERVRQLTDANGVALKSISPKGLVDENDFKDIQFFSENDSYISEIIRTQNLPISNKQLVILIDILSRRLGSDTIVKDGCSYLFSWDIWNKINFDKIDSFIKEYVSYKRTENIEVPINTISHHCVKDINDNEQNVVNQILIHYISEKFNIDINEEGFFIWEQTHVSNEEILEIVADKDAIITCEEILSECEKRFPGLKCTRIEVWQNPLITAVGLKGYVPTSERARYFSSIGDCAASILSEVGRPMNVSELFDNILEKGCVTTLNSLRSLLSRGEENRFLRLTGDVWGLEGFDYANVNLTAYAIVKKKPFNERLNDLKEFIDKNNRMPALNNDGLEASTARWVRNMMNKNIDATESEMEQLQMFLQEHNGIPQNLREYRFLENCKTYKKVVSFLGRRPSIESRPQLCTWFQSCSRRDNMSINCRRYFDELLEWLEAEGVYFS